MSSCAPSKTMDYMLSNQKGKDWVEISSQQGCSCFRALRRLSKGHGLRLDNQYLKAGQLQPTAAA